MQYKRIIILLAVTLIGLAASFILVTAFASAQPASSILPPVSVGDSNLKLTENHLALQPPPLEFPTGDWPWYAQEKIFMTPEAPFPGSPVEICAEVISLDLEVPHVGTLMFGVAPLGIGVTYTPVGITDVVVPPDGHAVGCVEWVPPDSGRWGIEVLLMQAHAQEPMRSLRNLDIWEPLMPGLPHDLVFPVGPLPSGGHITFTLANPLPGWDSQLIPAEIQEANPGEEYTITLRTIPPQGIPLGSRMPVVDVEGFLNGETIGGIRKFDTPPVPLHRSRDPFFAESEISVFPYPPRAGEPTQICVELFNLSDEPQHVEVLFNWANFGIGLPFDPINGPIPEVIPPHSHRAICITWVPPTSGHFCIQVEMNILESIDYEPQFSQRNLDVAEPLQPGVPHTIEFVVGNHFNQFTNPEPVLTTIWLEAEIHLPDWQVKIDPMVLPDMQPDEERLVTMMVTPTLGIHELPDNVPILDVSALVDSPDGPHVIGGFRKVFRPPVPLHTFPDPPYAEREITVHPYPPLAGEPTEVCVELRNPTPFPQNVVVHFSWANFGIGIPFTPINGPRMVYLPPFSMVKECIHWVPPVSGHVCLQVVLEMDGYEPQRSQRNIDVDEPLQPGVPDDLIFPVGNPSGHPVTITLGLIPHLDGWEFGLNPDVLPDMQPDEIREVTLTVQPPPEVPLPPDGQPIVDIEAFVEGELIGGFRKIFRPPVPIHRPKDPIYAESEIFVHPYPPRAHEPTEIGVEIRNPTDEPQNVTVIFSYANFGIGLPFTQIHDPLDLNVPPQGMLRPSIVWIPPNEDLWCIQVELKLPGHDEPFYSQRNIDVGEPLEPLISHTRTFLVGNPHSQTVTVTLGLVPHFPDWGLELVPDTLPGMLQGEIREVALTVTPPQDLPHDGDPIVDVEAFVEGELIGGFRKIFRPPVPVHRPKDPIYAESEIGIDPYPVIPGQPTELSVEVYNPTEEDRLVTATFSIAPFGIGLPFSSAHITPNPIHIFVPAHGAARGHVLWLPPTWRGKFCVKVTLGMEGHESIWSQRNIDVGEPLLPGEPHSLVFPVGAGDNTGPVSITLGLINHRDGWDVSLSEDSLENVQPDQPVTVTLTVTPPLDVELGTGEPIVDVEAYVDGELIGGLRKLDVPPIPIHKPHEKGYAESEIIIEPYPPQEGQKTDVSTVVQNTSDTEMSIILEYGWAKFGMGIPFTTTGMVPYTHTVTLSPEITKTVSVSWTPSLSGPQCIIIHLTDPGELYEPQHSQRNVDVVERPPCGEKKVFPLTVYNDSSITNTVDIGMITFDVPADWEVTTVPSDTLVLGPFSSGVIEVHVTIPCPNSLRARRALQDIYALQAQANGVPTIDVEGYIDGELVGGIELRFPFVPVPTQYDLYLPLIRKGS